MLQNTNTSPNGRLVSLLKRAHLVLLFVVSGMVLVRTHAAQSFTTADTKTGSILGTSC